MRLLFTFSTALFTLVFAANAWTDEALDTAKNDLSTKWDAVKSFSATLEIKMEVRRGESTVSAAGTGKVECLKKDGRELSRVEMEVNASAPGANSETARVTQRSLRVYDGAALFTENSMMGKTRTSKTTKGTSNIVGGGKALFDQLEKNYTLYVRPNEKTGDRVARVIEGEPKPDAPQKAQPSRFYFDSDSGALLKSEILDNTGKPQITTTVKDITINPVISEDRFKYQPPDGVTVLDADAVKPTQPAVPAPATPANPPAPASPSAPAPAATPAAPAAPPAPTPAAK